MQEHRRRREKDHNAIILYSTYIAMCVKVCQQEYFPNVLGPEEADMQVGRQRKSAVVICRDTDEIALGNAIAVFIDNWFKERYRVVDMTVPVTDAIAESHPLHAYYCRYGIRIIH